MWLAPLAGVAGVVLAVVGEQAGHEDSSAADVLVGLGLQGLLAVPVVLLGLSDAVTL